MRYLGISVTHHGNEKVKEEEEDDEDEEEPVDPPDVLVVGVGEALPHDEGIARGHHEDHHDALHGARHRVLLRDVLLFHVKKKSSPMQKWATFFSRCAIKQVSGFLLASRHMHYQSHY